MTINHSDLIIIQNLIYIPNGFEYSDPSFETESADYGACRFILNGLSILFRAAKITSTKTGQFVTLWKRTGKSPIQPFDLSDSIDLFVISVRKNDLLGQFVFPKSVLHEKGIVSKNRHGGKRAIRLYPAWDNLTSDQAKKTQNWQLKYFLEIPKNGPVDFARTKQLYL